MGTAHRALRGVHAHLGAILIAQHFGVLMDDRAGSLGSPRQALRVLERVQVSAARVEQARQIAWTAHLILKLVVIQQPRRLVAVFLVQLAAPFFWFSPMP